MNKIFEEAKIGPLTLRNRTIRSAAFESMCPGHEPSQMLYDYHTSVARGGVGMTTIAYAAVTESGYPECFAFCFRFTIEKRLIQDLNKFIITVTLSQEFSCTDKEKSRAIAAGLPAVLYLRDPVILTFALWFPIKCNKIEALHKISY